MIAIEAPIGLPAPYLQHETVKHIPLLFAGNLSALTVPAYMHGFPIIVSADRAGKAAHQPPKKKEHAPRQARRTDDNKRQRS